MHACFFRASVASAQRVRSSQDIGVDWIAEPLALGMPGALPALLRSMGGVDLAGFSQLRDATCQSFPVWSLGAAAVTWLGGATDAELETLAASWASHPDSAEMDADLHELDELLGVMRAACLECASDDQRLFVLLEETAF